MLVSVIFRQFGSCFGLFDIVGKIVVKYIINLYSLRNRLEHLAKGSLFCPFLKLVKIIFLFSDNVRILYTHTSQMAEIKISFINNIIRKFFNLKKTKQIPINVSKKKLISRYSFLNTVEPV